MLERPFSVVRLEKDIFWPYATVQLMTTAEKIVRILCVNILIIHKFMDFSAILVNMSDYLCVFLLFRRSGA